MKKIITAFLVIAALAVNAQKGETFPEIKGRALDGKDVALPFKNKKYTVVAMAYHRGAEDELKKWLNPLYYTFVKKQKGTTNFDMTEIYDVNFIFVPMISGFKKFADDFKASTDKEFWPYIVDTEKTDINALKKKLGVTESKIPYFYVLDADGKIVEVQSGEYKEAKIGKMEEAIE